jgi:hypothetical protein
MSATAPRTIPLALLMVCLPLCGFACAARRPHAATTQATTNPIGATRVLNLKDAVPLARFRNADREIDLRNRISYENGADLYFGQSDMIDGDGQTSATVPLIVASQRGGWTALSLDDVRLKNAEWQFIASGPAAGEIWGVLDDILKHKAAVLLLAHSTDAGQTWNVTSISKPFGQGEFDSFAMDKSGHGRLSVYLAPDDKHPRHAGFYHLRTTDGAKTWLPPEHEPDALDPAEEIPADDEPAPLKEAPAQNVRLDLGP